MPGVQCVHVVTSRVLCPMDALFRCDCCCCCWCWVCAGDTDNDRWSPVAAQVTVPCCAWIDRPPEVSVSVCVPLSFPPLSVMVCVCVCL